MSKKQDQKRKLKLNALALKESFRFQVMFSKNASLPELSDTDAQLLTELAVICNNDLNQSILSLRDIINGVRDEIGAEQEMDRNTLNGILVPFILGITSINPMNESYHNEMFLNANTIELPLQVKIYYDNEVRNRVVDWIKARYEGVTTRLAQPILKLPNMVVEFGRVVK